MMNMIELQDKLKNFSQDQLVSMMQQPTGEAPQFMVLSEITRRQKMQKEAESQQAPTQSVAQEAVAAAGVPQGGIADMARSLAPQTNVAQNTGVNPAAPPQGMPMPSAPQGPAPMAAAPQGIARMASGGVIKMQAAGRVDLDRYRELARRLIRDGSFSPEELKELEQIQNSNEFDNALAIEAELANSESLSDINPALPRVESSAPTPVFDATVEVPSLNQAPAADAGMLVTDNFIYGEGAASRPTYDFAAPSGLAALSPDTMPTVDGPFAYPASRFSTNLGSRAMLDWEEGQAEEAALIDARTNADLGSGRTPETTGQPSAEFRAKEDAMYGQKTPSRDPYLAAYSQDLIDAAKGTSTKDELQSKLDWLTAPKTGGIYNQEDVSKWLTPDAENPVAVPNIDNITDEELAKYTNKRPQPRPKDLFAPTTDNAREGGGSGSGSGSGGMSDYETELMKIMKSREKAAESDKWLALAQVGMGLMQGGSGSFLGDVGAAGMKGLETLRTSRDQADTDKLSLLKAREDARIDRARIAASAAKSTTPNAAALKSVIENLDIEMAPLAARAATGKLTPDERTQLDELKKQRNYYVNILGGLAGGGNGAYPAKATAAGIKDLSNNPPVERNFIGKGIDAVSSFVTG
jgi:rhodanese-related sulfurtransferase